MSLLIFVPGFARAQPSAAVPRPAEPAPGAAPPTPAPKPAAPAATPAPAAPAPAAPVAPAPAAAPESAPAEAPPPPEQGMPEPEAAEPTPAVAAAAPAPLATPAPSAPAPAPAPPETPKAAPTFEVSGAPGDGITLKSEAFSLNVKSRIQLRYQLEVPRADAEGERQLEQLVTIGTARLSFSGHAYTPKLTYLLQLALAGRDYREGITSPVYDAYLDLKAHRDFNVRAGQYFVPFDRLRTIRESGLQMADRPRPITELTLDRDVGVSVYSNTFLHDASPVAVRLGAFGGGGTNLSEGREPGALLVGRLELRPLGPIDDDMEGDLERRDSPAVAIGGAVAKNWNTNRARSTTGATFVGGTTDYVHAATDLVFKWLGFAFQAEYLWRDASDDQIVSLDDMGVVVTEATRSGRGWILQASYTFDPPIEVVGRLSRLYAAEGTDPAYVAEVEARAQEVAGGLNYYFNGHKLKLQADWIARMPEDFDTSQADHVAHLQLDATF